MARKTLHSGWKVAGVSTVVSAVLIAGSFALPGYSAEDARQINAREAVVPDAGFADLIEQVEPSVVTVEVKKAARVEPSAFHGDPRAREFFERFFGPNGPAPSQPHQARGMGSGFIIDREGYIVTNNHVIDGADNVTVRLSDDREFEAEVVGVDDKTDLALLKIDAEDLRASSLGDSDSARVGDWVVAIGNPFGLGGTATVGIVSARGRDIRSGPYDDYMQIDAPINRGNSGGPVFNTEGEVVGVNTAIFSPNGGSVGIGFAIPSNQVRTIVDELKTSGSIDRGWLGVQLQNIDDDLAASLGLEHNEGALVADVVPDSPAAEAGLAVGDVIVSYDGRDVGDARELARMVGASDGGDKVKLGVVRDATEIRIKVTLGDADTKVASTGSEHQLEKLGMTLAPMNEETRRRMGMDSELSGALVVKVDPNGEAASQGIRRGDVLIQANRRTIESPSDFRKALSKAKKNGRDSVPVLVRRGDAQQFVSLSVA